MTNEITRAPLNPVKYMIYRICDNEYVLTTNNYENDSYFFYRSHGNHGLIKLRVYHIEDLKEKCWYAHESLIAHAKATNYDYSDKRFCFVASSADDAGFCILTDTLVLDDINPTLEIYYDIYELVNDFPISFMYT